MLLNVLFSYCLISVNIPCVQRLECSSCTKNPFNKCKKSGKQTLMQYATEQELGNLCQHITNAVDLRIHNYCSKSLRNQIRERKNYSESNELPKKSSRLWLEQDSDRKQNCFYCGKLCLIQQQHPERHDSHLVDNLYLKEKWL